MLRSNSNILSFCLNTGKARSGPCSSPERSFHSHNSMLYGTSNSVHLSAPLTPATAWLHWILLAVWRCDKRKCYTNSLYFTARSQLSCLNKTYNHCQPHKGTKGGGGSAASLSFQDLVLNFVQSLKAGEKCDHSLALDNLMRTDRGLQIKTDKLWKW